MGVDRLFASRQEPWASRPRRRVVWWMIGTMVGIFFLERLTAGAMSGTGGISFRNFVSEWFAVSADGLLSGRIWQLFTYQVLHADGWHLFLNMLVLYFLGTFYEDLRGSRNLVWTFLLCGAFAGLACFLEGTHVVGASGSILALLLVLAVQIPNQQVILLFFPMRMKWVAVLIVSLDVLQLLTADPDSHVANFTHLVGALAGFTYAYVWPQIINPRLHEASATRKHRREVAALEKTLEETQELDRILDKISRVGMQNLTDEERRFLKRTSEKLQDARRS